MASIDDLRMDLSEMEKLVAQATRQRVKGVLTVETHKLRTQLSQLLAEQKETTQSEGGASKPQQSAVRRYAKSITNYAWDQSEKFMKIYVTINGVQGVPKENVTCEFTDSSFKLLVKDLNNSDHQCHIVKLFEDIIPEKSYHKIKSDSVLVMLKKNSENTWAYVTKQESKTKEKKPDLDPSGDPQEGMMKMMQKMYEDGDDEMKRTIAKSMYESRNKSQVEMPN